MKKLFTGLFLFAAALVIFVTPAYAFEDPIYEHYEWEAPREGSCGVNAFWRVEGEGDALTLVIHGSGEMTNYEYDLSSEETPEEGGLPDGAEPQSPVGYDTAPAPWQNYYEGRIVCVVVEEGITSVGNNAFSNFHALREIRMASSVKTIGEKAFVNAVSLTTVYLPEGITRINAGAFSGCTALTDIRLPDSAVVIGNSVFASCTSLTSLTLPASMRSVAAYLCEGCTSLTQVTIPAGATGIGFAAFSGCERLTDLAIPDSVVTIGGYAFYGCTSLSSCVIPQGVEQINVSCFEGCAALQSVTIPQGVREIAYAAFFECPALAQVSYNGSYEQWAQIAIDEYNDALNAVSPFPSGPPGNTPFADVPADVYYESAVLWAVEKGITTGRSAVRFAPDEGCSRAMLVTFLHRAASLPEAPAGRDASVFNDINNEGYYINALRWAYASMIVNGTGEGTFSPDEPCTRAQLVTMLYRMRGTPDVNRHSIPFTDVPGDMYYTSAVAWAYGSGLTRGKTETLFAPDEILTRAEAITFLYRLDNLR